MKITTIEAWAVETPLAVPYIIAYDAIESMTNIFLRLETDNGINGYGCAAPDLPVTGETPASVLQVYQDTIVPAVKGQNPLMMTRIMEELRPLLHPHPSAAAMIDMALWDILGKTARLPLYKLLGGYRDSIPTSTTIGILPLEKTVSFAKEWVKKGFRILKIKGGLDVATDIERIIKVREAVGKSIQIRFDANQGYSLDQALAFSAGVKHEGIQLIEQPTPKSNPALLKEFRRGQTIPVMADESLMNLEDALFLVTGQMVDLFNIKLMKVGGIAAAMAMDHVARVGGVQSMVGCMDESSLAIAAALHFTLASPNVIYADLDGHLDLLNDPAADCVTIHNGILFPRQQPGLGTFMVNR